MLPFVLLAQILACIPEPSSATQSATVRVGVYQNAPKVFTDTDGTPSGFFIDLLQAIAAREHWILEFIPCTWDHCLRKLELGELDIMPDVAHTKPREYRFLFGREAVISSWSVLYRHRNSDIQSLLDLQGRRIGLLKDSIQSREIRSLLHDFNVDAVYVEVESFEKAFSLLQSGSVDCVLANRFYGDQHYRDYPAEKTNILIRPGVLKYAFAPGRGDLLIKVDEHLADLRKDQDSAYYQARQRWIDPLEHPGLPGWIAWGGGIAVAVILVLLLQVLLFQRMVQNRTRQLISANLELQHLAEYDDLTGLPNRSALTRQLYKAVNETGRQDFALVFMNIDHFRDINDAMSHETGDSALRYFSLKLRAEIPANYSVARIGVDEFAVVMEGLTDINALEQLLIRLQHAFEKPFRLNQQPIYLSFSAGVALYPEHGEDVKTLFQSADMALQRSRQHSRGHFAFYHPELGEAAAEKLNLVGKLRESIDGHRLEVHFQPKIDAISMQMAGCEALLRWNHPELGPISPLTIIPLAESSGLIIPLGTEVLEVSLRHYAQWLREGLQPGTLAVNVSMLQLNQERFCENLLSLLERHNIHPSHFEIELTETQLMKQAEDTLETLHQLHASGITIAVDDFGTGYSSLAYLKQLPIGVLKIDKSFIREIPGNGSDMEITRAIIAMARSLNLQTVAEGVESDEQVCFLRESGCDQLQGYLFHRPLPADEMRRLLHQGMQRVG